MERANGSQADQSKFEVKSLNPVGLWVENFRINRRVSWKEAGEIFELSGIRHVSYVADSNISLYSMGNILQGAERYGCTDYELTSLADAVEVVIALTLKKRGKLYDRLPPTIPKKVAEEVIGSCSVYTDTSLAKNILGEDASDEAINKLKSRINNNRNDLDITPVFFETHAHQIMKKIKDFDQSRELSKKHKSEFAIRAAGILGIKPEKFSKCEWILRCNLPNSEEFGEMLSNIEMSDEKREQLVTLWIEKYREKLRVSDKTMRKEFGLSRERMRQLKDKVDPDRSFSSWDQIERIRKYRARL